MLEEKKVLAEVSVYIDSQTISVRWDNQILKDGEVISYIPERMSFAKEEKNFFLQNVSGAEKYIEAIGW